MLKNKIKINSTSIDDPLFVLSKISKNFASREVFSNIDLVMRKKDRLAIVGPNGTGKSTFSHRGLFKGKGHVPGYYPGTQGFYGGL